MRKFNKIIQRIGARAELRKFIAVGPTSEGIDISELFSGGESTGGRDRGTSGPRAGR